MTPKTQTNEFILRHVEQQAEAGGLAEPSPVKFGASSQGPYWSEAAWNNLVKQSLNRLSEPNKLKQLQQAIAAIEADKRSRGEIFKPRWQRLKRVVRWLKGLDPNET